MDMGEASASCGSGIGLVEKSKGFCRTETAEGQATEMGQLA
jgi:hypothetical protein